MTIHEALCALGVRDDTLTAAEKGHLDREGYLPLLNLISAGEVAALTARLEELLVLEGQEAGKEINQQGATGVRMLSDLVNKGPVFDVCFTHPRVLAAMWHVLRHPFRLSSLNYRVAYPGHGLQGLHADWGKPVEPGAYQVCNSIWLLDDFTEENGATRVVPGSHRSARLSRDEMPDPNGSHPREMKLIAPAGSVVIFNAHTWHGGTHNSSTGPRRALHSYFCRREHKQQVDQRRYVLAETQARLSEAARFVLDV